jgi:hypothetical protein
LILQSKFALIEGNAQGAYELLEEAQKLAEDKELATLAVKASTQQDAVKAELTQWQELAQRNAPLQQRLELADLEGYLQEAIRLREQTSTIRS